MMDSVEWLDMMVAHSPLTDCKPHFAKIAEELRHFRQQRGKHAVVFEVTSPTNGKIAINAAAVAWIGLSAAPVAYTAICISGKETDLIHVTEPYDEVVELLREALDD